MEETEQSTENFWLYVAVAVVISVTLGALINSVYALVSDDIGFFVFEETDAQIGGFVILAVATAAYALTFADARKIARKKGMTGLAKTFGIVTAFTIVVCIIALYLYEVEVVNDKVEEAMTQQLKADYDINFYVEASQKHPVLASGVITSNCQVQFDVRGDANNYTLSIWKGSVKLFFRNGEPFDTVRLCESL